MISHEISNYDNISSYDNSMYVLPPKTKLNREFYTHDTDILYNNGNISKQNDFTERKVSNNVDIPTYKGFSVANGYSRNSKKSNLITSEPKSHTNNLKSERHIISRKTHLSSGISNVNNQFISMKNYPSVKLLQKPKLNYEKEDIKKNKNETKPIKRIETYLGNPDNGRRQIKSVNKSNDNVLNTTNKISDSKVRPSKDHEAIKNYMNNKRKHSKQLIIDSKLEENERRAQIEKRLKLLSEKIKVKEKVPGTDQSNQKYEKPIPERHDFVEVLSVNPREPEIVDHVDMEIEDEICDSIKTKWAHWTPMDSGELEMHRQASQRHMRNAISSNRQTDSILQNILAIHEEMNNTKQQLSKFIDRQISDQNYNSSKPKTKIIWQPSSTSDMSDHFEERNYNEPRVAENRFMKERNMRHNIVKTEVAPSIIANRALRKLDMDYIDDEQDLEHDSSSMSDFDNCVSRLIEENQKRYERSLEKQQVITLPFNKTVTKPMVGDHTNHAKYRDAIETLGNDSLSFMKTYRRYKHNTDIVYHTRTETYTNNSRISRESLHGPSKSHKTHHSLQVSNNISIEYTDNSTLQSINDQQFSTSDSKSKTVRSVINRNNVQSSNEFSETDVTMEKSSTDYSPNRPVAQHTKAQKRSHYQGTERRLSPNSLERQLMIELHYHDTVQASIEQLLQADRFQGVGFAQQETVSLAQILKARQWKDTQGEEANLNLQRFTTALENLNNHQSYRRRRMSSSSSSSTIDSSSNHVIDKRVQSTTESDASEIEEEIVDFSNSIDSQHHSPVTRGRRPNAGDIKPDKKSGQIATRNKPIIDRDKTEEGSVESVIETEILHSNIDESAQEISTVISISKTSSSEENKVRKISTETESTTESVESQTFKSKTANDSDRKFGTGQRHSEISNATSIKTETNLSQSDKKSIVTATSVETDQKSRPKPSWNNESKSSAGGSRTDKTPSNMTNYSRDDFETSVNGTDSEHSFSVSDIEITKRLRSLENEKEKKERLVDKLKHKLSLVKQRSKEKSLRHHINLLDSQIDTLKDQLKNPDPNSSSISLSPITKSKRPKSTVISDINLLPSKNRMSTSTSSSSSISKDDDASSISMTANSSSSSTTLVSDVKDKSLNNAALAVDSKRLEDVDTPRSAKQIQFEDINEEYSASNQDSSDPKTPSERSRLSKDLTDNGVSRSKSENFHILNFDDQNDEKDQESNNNENEDVKIASARTIHSEISEIPLESDLSEQEIDDFFEKLDESEKQKSNSPHDAYSEDFSEITSQKYSKHLSLSHSEPIDISFHNEIYSYEPSPESSKSSESDPPVIPLRRKHIARLGEEDSPPLSDRSVRMLDTIDQLCNSLFTKMFDEVLIELDPDEVFESTIPYEKVSPVPRLNLDEDSAVNLSIDSLNDKLTDAKYEALARVVPWKDENVIPLVELAIDQLFSARRTRRGTTEAAFVQCVENMPATFYELNSEEEIYTIHHKWCVYRIRDPQSIEVHRLFISRLAIYRAVLEIVSDIYELDDQPQPSPWMEVAFQALWAGKLALWQDSNPPESVEKLTRIVMQRLQSINVIGDSSGSCPPSAALRRSRQHQWFTDQTNDIVDRLLIDETFQEDTQWQRYDQAIEKTVVMITDDILNHEMWSILDSLVPDRSGAPRDPM